MDRRTQPRRDLFGRHHPGLNAIARALRRWRWSLHLSANRRRPSAVRPVSVIVRGAGMSGPLSVLVCGNPNIATLTAGRTRHPRRNGIYRVSAVT